MAEYIVTARKWRPMKFEDVAGQGHITTTLRNAIASHRLAHAYLFSGPRGVGKTTSARLLAKAVNCAHPVDQNPDNSCESCVEITEGRSFDVLEIDGASNRGVDEIRNLRESVRYPPAKGSYKVYIIDEVHMLTKEAFNALLKTLEEPPEHVLFIFATTEINKLPATILSRCQRFEFRRIKTDDIATNLRIIAAAEGLQADEDALMLVARKGDGSLRDAQSLFDQVVALCGREITAAKIVQAFNLVNQEVYFRVTDLIKNGDIRGGLGLVDEIMTKGHDLKEFLVGLTEHLRNLLIVKSTGSTSLIEAADVHRQRYAAEALSFSVADLLRLQRLVGGTESALRWAVQPRFRLEADMVQMISMPKAQEVGELLQRIDDIKKKASDGVGSTVPPATPAVVPARVTPPLPAIISAPKPNPPLVPTIRSPETEKPRAMKAPAALPSSVREGEVASRWQEFLGEVRLKKISLWSTMESTRLLGVEGDVVRLGCTDDFQASMVDKNKEALAEMFYKVFTVRPRLLTEIAPGEIGSTGTPGNAKPDATPESDHPVIAALKRELGAEPV